MLAFLGGVVFNIANILMVAAIAISGLAVAFPIGIGLALVVGVLLNHIISPRGNPLLLFGGVALVALAIIVDAIAYRRARVTAPCPDCTASGQKCDDHACDLDLIAAYQQTAIAAILDVPSRIDASQPGGSPLAAPTPSPPS